jgi:hypothetical protein
LFIGEHLRFVVLGFLPDLLRERYTELLGQFFCGTGAHGDS